MEDTQPGSHDRQPAAQSEGAFEVGAEIQQRSNTSERPDVAQAVDREVDGAQADVVGDNAGVLGDADAMTSGASDDPRPDDTAQRSWGLATDTGTDPKS